MWRDSLFYSRSHSRHRENPIQANTIVALIRTHRINLTFSILERCQTALAVAVPLVVSEGFHRVPQIVCQCSTMLTISISMTMKWTKVKTQLSSATGALSSCSFTDSPIIRDVPLYNHQQRQVSASQSNANKNAGEKAIRISFSMLLFR